MSGLTQHVTFYPRQAILLIYQVYYHIINLFKATRHSLRFICNSFHLKWTNVFKYCYYHPTQWEDLESCLPFDMTIFISTDFVTKHTPCAWWETIHGTRLNNYRLYIFKRYIFCHAVFCRIINAFSSIWKMLILFSLVFKVQMTKIYIPVALFQL